jgi:hypothetical protein
MEKKKQKEVLLEALKTRDMNVRQIMMELWINSPTKIISELVKDGCNIIDCTPDKIYKTYRYIKPEMERFL